MDFLDTCFFALTREMKVEPNIHYTSRGPVYDNVNEDKKNLLE